MVDVLYEDNHLLVINKPPMLVTQGARPGEDSVVQQAADYLRKKYNKPGNVFVGVVSRLDARVSGVLVLARTSKAASRLSQQIRERSMDKIYLGMTSRPLPQAAGTLEDWLLKNEERQRVEVVGSANRERGAQQAILHYEQLFQWPAAIPASEPRWPLYRIHLVTGRKHQIRVQLAARQCPLLGDQKYGSREPFPVGIALHCATAGVEHPTRREKMEFTAPLPRHWFK